MLSPEYLDECSNQLINLYSELENRIIADIVRRLLKTGNITETAKWEILKAQELGLLYDDVLSLIASQTDATSNHVKALFENAGVETVNIDNEKYRKMGKTPIDIRQSDSIRQVLEAGYQKTLGNLQNLTMTTAITSQTAFINASNSAYMMVTSGAFSYQDAIRTAIKEMAQKGVTVLTDTIKYEGINKKGQHYTHEDKIDVAVRRNVLTGVGQTCKQVSLTNAQENGFDLMEINAHSGARPSHAKFQGQRVSLSGRKGYLSLHDIGFGSAEGFGGCNRRHDWYPVDENDIPMYTDSQLQDFDAKNIEYNGKKYTQYEATQIQRRKEREIRALKREAVAYDTAIKETNDEELKSKLKDDFTNTSKKLKDKEKALADFTKETGIKRDKFREQVQGFNRSVSSKSTWANKKSRNSLTSAQNSGNIKEREYEYGIIYGSVANTRKIIDYIDDKTKFKYSSKFKNLTENKKVNQSVCKCSKTIIKHRIETDYEDMYIINANTGKIMGFRNDMHTIKGNNKSFVKYNDSINNALEKAESENIPIISIHNHPDGYPPSADDLVSALKHGYKFGLAIGHNGQVYKYYPAPEILSIEELDNIQNWIALNYKNGMDIDRAYQSVFEQFGLKYEILRGDEFNDQQT